MECSFSNSSQWRDYRKYCSAIEGMYHFCGKKLLLEIKYKPPLTPITCSIILSKSTLPVGYIFPKISIHQWLARKMLFNTKRELPAARLPGWVPLEMPRSDTNSSITAKTNLPNITQWQVRLFCQLRREGKTVGWLNEKAGSHVL